MFIGRTYLALGMPYKAVPVLRKALDLSSPKGSRSSARGGSTSALALGSRADLQSKIMALLGTAYLKSKNSQAALGVLEDAVNLNPDDKRIYRAYLNALMVRGIRLCGLGEYEAGLAMLRFVLANGNESGMADNLLLRLHLGRAARETGQLNEGLLHYTEALRLSRGLIVKEGDRWIRWSRASILMALGRIEEARAEIDIIRSRHEDVPELPWNNELIDLFMIQSFLSNREWRRTIESCRNWLKQREDMPLIRAFYAEALRNTGNYKAAHNHLLRAQEASPKDLDFLYADILVSWEGEDYKSLRRALRIAKSLGGDRDLIKRYSILLEAKTSENVMKLIPMVQDGIRTLGPDPDLMYILGESYLRIGFLEEGRNWFTKTLGLKENHEKAWLGLISAEEALSHSGEEDNKTAALEGLKTAYNAYLERWADNAIIRRERALFLVKSLEFEEAARDLETLLVWEPANLSLRRVLAYCYRKTGRYREAALFLKPLLKERPRDMELLMEYALCLERSGAIGIALAFLEKTRERYQSPSRKKDLSVILLVLGILQYKHKDLQKAQDILQESAALNTKDHRPWEWLALIAGKRGKPQEKEHCEQEAQNRKKAKK